MAQYINKDALVAEIERRINAYQKNFDKADNKIARLSTDGRIQGLKSFLSFINNIEVKKVQEEHVSEDLKEAAEEWDESLYRSDAFKAGAKWQLNKIRKNEQNRN